MAMKLETVNSGSKVGEMTSFRRLLFALLWVVPLLCQRPVEAQTLPSFDFTNPADTAGWSPAHGISALFNSSTGMVMRISGADPYTIGPAKNYPPGMPLWLRLKMFSEAGGGAQVFYFSNSATEAASVRFNIPTNAWAEAKVPVPALGSNYRMRIDPPGTNGTATLRSLQFAARDEFPDFDFTTIPDSTSWTAQRDIGSLQPAPDGLVISINGSDPYLAGPPSDYPAGKLLWLHVQLKSDVSGSGQMFYYQTGPTEERSVRFYVPAGVWHEAVVPMPALGNGWRLRFDPPGGSGTCTLKRIWFEERVIYAAPAWPKPLRPNIAPDALRLVSGELLLEQNKEALGAFRLSHGGKTVGFGNSAPLIGYAMGNQTRWLPLGTAGGRTLSHETLGSGFRLTQDTIDADWGHWRIEQSFTTNSPDAIDVETRITVDSDRQVLYLPAFTLLASVADEGTNKSQALLAGLEYLENEASSSELDIKGEGARRLVPDRKKITFPLMAIASGERCIGVMWEPQPDLAPVFDSPDRQFASGGHLLGLILPGPDGLIRDEGSLLPYGAKLVRSNEAIVVRCTITGSHGRTVVPALRKYLELSGLPPIPAGALSFAAYCTNAAGGWLDSEVRTDGLIRHAVWPGFNAQPAADAAVWMRWLAERVTDAGLSMRLSNAAAIVLAQVTNPALYNNYGVGHVRYPLAALIFGSVLANASQSRTDAINLLGRFQPDGSVLYVPPANGTDLGSTHYSREANGLAANVVNSLLNEAVFSGDRELISTALERLRAMDKFRDGVPRGAQTWEVPLHTPDILASAYLVQSYVMGYQLTGEVEMLEQARYWAWTGVPFVYLTPPVSADVGLYGTIPVFGATHWVGSWFGRPVQWCGLVYSEALYQLAQVDATGPWKQVADGIVASGTQQVFPLSDLARQGLLPDFYLLEPQVSDGPAINPGTLQSQAAQWYTGQRPFTFRTIREHGLIVHAPGAIGELAQNSSSMAFTVTNWSAAPTWILIGGLERTPEVKINGINTAVVAPHQYDATRGLLTLRIQGVVRIELGHPAIPKLEIRGNRTNASVEVSWPAANSNYVLQQTSSITSGAAWSNAALPVSIQGSRRVAVDSAAATSRSYRLKNSP